MESKMSLYTVMQCYHAMRNTSLSSLTFHYIYVAYSTLSQKVCHLMFVNNFGKCGPIFKILFTN